MIDDAMFVDTRGPICCTDCRIETDLKRDYDKKYRQMGFPVLIYNQCPKCDAIYTPETGKKVTMDELVERTRKEYERGSKMAHSKIVCIKLGETYL